MAEAFEAHVEGGGAGAGFLGEVFDSLCVGEGEELAVLGWHVAEAGLEGAVFGAAVFDFLEGLVGHELEDVLAEDETVAGDFAAVGEGLEAGDDAGPLHEVGVGFVQVELFPDDHGGLLEDFVGVGPAGEEGAHEAAEIRLEVGEALDEDLVASIFGGD